MKCSWANCEPIESYHDQEYGKLITDNTKLFELLVLEIFQPGLSFNIVLKKREGLRTVFKDYDLNAIKQMTENDIELALANPDIIRHKLKITSVIANASLIVDNNIDILNYIFTNIDYRFGIDKVGTLLSKQMKKDGFKFVGPSVTTSLLEAIGLLPCHSDDCDWKPITNNTIIFPTPIGNFEIKYDNFKILSSSMLPLTTIPVFTPVNSFEYYLHHQVTQYFEGSTLPFKLALELKGTEFQLRVWDAICNVPYGQTMTYSDIAYTIGTGAFRAVGSAAAKVNFSLFIPAHRIVAASGIGGFQNKVELKRQLLLHEGITEYT